MNALPLASLAVLLLPFASAVGCSGGDASSTQGSAPAGAGGESGAGTGGMNTAGKGGGAMGGASLGGTSGLGGNSVGGGAGGSAGVGGANGGMSGKGAAGSSGAPVGGAGGTGKSGSGGGGGASPPCTTRISYGNAWIHPASHPEMFDVAPGSVTWDGHCTADGANSYATLSNGWKPYFAGHGDCVMAFDEDACPGAATGCSTRVTYGAAWKNPPAHPADFDVVSGRVFSDAVCHPSGGDSFVDLSNGWQPNFTGTSGCEVSFGYFQCGGLYQNAIVAEGCADPGVLRDGKQYVMACTGGDGGGAYVLRTSSDLVSWKKAGHIFPSGTEPVWAKGSFWAPEVHRIGTHYVAYFSALHTSGRLAIGAATATTALGPFKDIGKPLVLDPSMGMIDAHAFEDSNGTPHLVWKEDGNAVGAPTPIYGQTLSADGTSLVGGRVTLISNDLPWEGPLVEGPFVVHNGGFYYLFYSANAYYNATYAVGVARSASPLGPYQKKGPPIVTTDGAWVGPGHCSVVDGPSGDTYMVYHGWEPGKVNGPGDQRLGLLDAIVWGGGWPSVPAAPSRRSRPMP